MNCGIVGYGKMGKIRKESIEKLGHNVKIICDVDETFNKILLDKNIKCVFICTPNYLNKEYTINSLLHSKHVFCEKPPTLTVEELNEVIKIEKETNLKLMYGFNHRHHKSIQYIKHFIESGQYGKILWMRGRYGKSIDNDFFKTWRSNINLVGGGILLDQGIHLLDLFIYMSGGFDKVKSFISNDFWKLEGIEDNAFIILKNSKHNITASLHSTMTQWRHIFSFEIFLEKGCIVLNGLKTSSGSYGNEVLTISDTLDNFANALPNEKHEYNINDSWDNELKYFFDCIENDKKVEMCNSNDALKIMTIIDTIYQDKDF